MNKKIIIFDMDGVLFDSMGIAQKYFTERHPGVSAAMYQEMYTGNYHEEVKKYLHLRLSESDEKKIQDQSSYAELKSKAPMFVGVKNLLEDLHKLGLILILNTSAFVKTTMPLLENAAIETLFDFVATAEISKSKTEKFNLIAEKYQTNKKDILFITDSLGDVREADLANIETIAVTWGIHGREYFSLEANNNLIGVVDSVDELRESIY